MLVLGAGVIGLSTAVCLAEAGHRVRVWAERLPAETTSAVASGVWVPGLTPRDLEWSRVTLAELSALAGREGTGVHPEWGLEVSDLSDEQPVWAAELPEMRPCRPDELPPGMRTGLWARVPMIDLPVYLDFLGTRLAEAGAELRRRAVGDLAEAAAAAPVVVNCTGVAAGRLAGDPRVRPVRGQHVVVRNPGVEHFYIEAVDSTEWTGFFPHGDRVLLAGVSQPGDWSLEPDPEVAEGILRRCARIEPRFAEAEVLGHLVGLRPGREAARLEEERVGSARVVHNYGHGGEGVSLSWGSARAVERLLTSWRGRSW
ncbi:D-amino-acid oxidase [Amycolatopsis cihanbeyliensis]|uniref:D-amino-acid oxidase n=1 Tax=Amycolatopsis cihanbeyliensis TaxID=1128664 RepID=A0A542CSZ9_AMYCI|nr:D-amino-acid oxidase [Amycolatopsis cihanbeyliensis]